MDHDGDRLTIGQNIRREVLGDEHVDQSLGNASELFRPLQEFVTEYCWGAIWARPGLSRQARSIINIAILSALNRQHELKLHVMGALRNGCSPEEIREVIMQLAVYCGVPASIEASRTTERALQEYGAASADGRGVIDDGQRTTR